MNVNLVMNRWDLSVRRYHAWMHETNYVNKTILAFMFASLTGLGAFIKIYTPLSPIPFTAQTFFVLMSGVMLGKYWGPYSQMLYVGIGIAGVPWFAGGTSGLVVVTGATGGYLIGFVFASAFLGFMSEGRATNRETKSLIGLNIIASLMILTSGTLGLVALGFPPSQAILFGFLPFLITDTVKSFVAGGASVMLTSKMPY
jgi:biotin transport system substrate-specific component